MMWLSTFECIYDAHACSADSGKKHRKATFKCWVEFELENLSYWMDVTILFHAKELQVALYPSEQETISMYLEVLLLTASMAGFLCVDSNGAQH